MTKREVVRKLREINPEWAKSFKEEKLNPRAMFGTDKGATLAGIVISTFPWCDSKRGLKYWSAVYDALYTMKK